MDDVRTLGWTLAIGGSLTFGLVTFMYIHAFLVTGRFSTEVGILVPMGLPALGGLLAVVVGIRIVRGTPRNGPLT